MTTDELHAYLDSKEPLTVNQVKNIICQLQHDSFCELFKVNDVKNWRYNWYSGQINGFHIALDLLNKVRSDDE